MTRLESKTHSAFRTRYRGSGLIVSLMAAVNIAEEPVRATDIQWTRMTAQFPVEASPLVGQFGKTGATNMVIINQGGQVLLWSLDGRPLGPGQDGLVAQLPIARWTTQPAVFNSKSKSRLVFTSVKGQVVCLDDDFKAAWERQLSGETIFGRAVPAAIGNGDTARLVFSDGSGLLTCLKPDGAIAWTNALGAGPCHAPPKTISSKTGDALIIAASGSNLFCCNASGKLQWRRELPADISSRAEDISFSGRQIIVCGLNSGALVALDLSGNLLWECDTGDTISAWLAIVQRKEAGPLIVFTGLWGNLHAVDVQGHKVWTHFFRSKTRALPLVLENNGDPQIFIPAFNQHIYAFDANGRLSDDIRLSGILPSGLTPVSQNASANPDLLITTTTLLAYRLQPGPPKSPYGPTLPPRDVTITIGTNDAIDPSVVVHNPGGALLIAHICATNKQNHKSLTGTVSTRSAFELPLKSIGATNGEEVLAEVRDLDGKLLAENRWTLPIHESIAKQPSAEDLTAWPTEPYGAFEETRANQVPAENPQSEPAVRVENLYINEVDESAMILDSKQSVRARVSLSRLAREDGVPFGGTVTLRQTIPVGTVNGETVPDALPALGDAGLVSVEPGRAVKIWLSVDAHGAQPGSYTGQIAVVSLEGISNKLALPLKIQVLDLRIPGEFPLTLCTWDYIPNRWFSNSAAATLDDMGRHGVNIFPRTTLPPGRVDAAGKLTIDWSPLDAELSRLIGRGKILFHLGHPPIEFTGKRSDEEKHSNELEYVRTFRDHLKERGRAYDDFALYLLDEPGLDYGTNVASLLDVGKLFREADPKLILYTDPVPGLSWNDFKRIEPLVDVWTPNMRLVSGLLSGDPRIAQIIRAKTVWSYECVAQVKSISPLRYNRANAWRAKYFGLSGIGYWTHSTTDTDMWLAGKTDNDEFALVYPGELPVPSVRWEAVRDGLEDVAAMSLLEDEIHRHRQAGTRLDIADEAEAELRIARRDVMELSDQAFVESRDFLRKGDRTLPHTGTDVETYRHHRAEIARLTLALKAGRTEK
jgi:hypothetical protein